MNVFRRLLPPASQLNEDSQANTVTDGEDDEHSITSDIDGDGVSGDAIDVAGRWGEAGSYSVVGNWTRKISRKSK